MHIEDRLARHIADLSYDNLPTNAIEATKDLLVDTLADIAASLRSRECRAIRDRWTETAAASEASVVSAHRRIPAAAAAFVNAVFAHWYEWDDVHHPSLLHASAVIFPSLLAAAEASECTDGRDAGRGFMTACVAAFDVAARVGEALAPHLDNGWMPTANAAVGAAGSAARLLGLGQEGVLSAMGIAASSAGVGRQPIKDRVNGKNILCGLVAESAVRAALLSRYGIQGAPHFLFGEFGMSTLFAGGQASPAVALAELGDRFSVTESAVKPYPCCRSTHGCIDAMLDLLSEEPDLLEKTDSIDLRLPRPNFELVGNPFRPQDDPRVSAQFSVAYTVALALRHGGVQIDDFDADRIRGDQETQKLADSIRVTANDEGYHQVHLRLSDGSTRKRRV
ncbi:MAG: MmgE/PrpD family protein, partial [Alphaproteobacteria bacterium]|nr:MmgE/PrpD family protein [Alphaproteobacteria bacterium]